MYFPPKTLREKVRSRDPPGRLCAVEQYTEVRSLLVVTIIKAVYIAVTDPDKQLV